MSSCSGELLDILGTFAAADFAGVSALIRQLATNEGLSVSKSSRAVPTGELQDIYSFRALNPRAPKVLTQELERFARLADKFPTERWHIFSVRGESVEVAVFANEEGVGRFCLDFTMR